MSRIPTHVGFNQPTRTYLVELENGRVRIERHIVGDRPVAKRVTSERWNPIGLAPNS